MPANGLGFRIGGAPLAATFPALRRDTRLVDGSLFLADFGHPDTSLGLTGVPVQGSVITNIARRPAARLCGKTKDQLAQLDGTWKVGPNGAANQLKVERTAAGRVHILMSLANDANTFAGINLPDAVKQFILDNTTLGNAGTLGHQIAVFMSYRVTRAGPGTGNSGNLAIGGITSLSGNNSSLEVFNITNNTLPYQITDTSVEQLGNSTTILNGPNVTGAEVYRGAAVKGWGAAGKPTLAQFGDMIAGSGPGNGYGSFPSYQHLSPSIALGHVHVVDLTVGDGGVPLTYWQMLARDRAITQARYTADTVMPTDPSTFA